MRSQPPIASESENVSRPATLQMARVPVELPKSRVGFCIPPHARSLRFLHRRTVVHTRGDFAPVLCAIRSRPAQVARNSLFAAVVGFAWALGESASDRTPPVDDTSHWATLSSEVCIKGRGSRKTPFACGGGLVSGNGFDQIAQE